MLAFFRSLVENSSARAFFILVVVLTIWASYQDGGINQHLIQSYLLLTLPLCAAALGVVLVLITGQFDISAAGIITIVDVLMATKLTNLNPFLSLILMLIFGALAGLINALFVIYAKLPAIAVTLSTLTIFSGFGIVMLPQPGGVVSNNLVSVLNKSYLLPVPLLIIALLILLSILFRNTVFGVHVYGLGQDQDALKLSGISVNRLQIVVFMLAGAFYGLSGYFLAGLTATGDPAGGVSYTLSTFAAVAIGGAAFIGGSGSGVGTIFGCLVLVAVPKVLFVLGVSGWAQIVVQGLIIVVAVFAGAFLSRKAKINYRARMMRLEASDFIYENQTKNTEGGGLREG
jgi:ribose transport system permease protein